MASEPVRFRKFHQALEQCRVARIGGSPGRMIGGKEPSAPIWSICFNASMTSLWFLWIQNWLGRKKKRAGRPCAWRASSARARMAPGSRSIAKRTTAVLLREAG